MPNNHLIRALLEYQAKRQQPDNQANALPLLMNPNLQRQGNRNALAAALRAEPQSPLLDSEFYKTDLRNSAQSYFSDPENSLRAIAAFPIPVVSDTAGLVADALMYKNKPDERTPLNFGMTALGALPFFPAVSGMIKSSQGRIPETVSDATALANLLSKHGESVGATLDNAATGSKYVTFPNPNLSDLDLTVRLANHAANPSNNLGRKTFSVDPTGNGDTFENALMWLKSNGVSIPNLTARAETFQKNAARQKIAQEIADQTAAAKRIEELKNQAIGSYRGHIFQSTKVNSGGRRYDLIDQSGAVKSFYSKDIPDGIKAGSRENLIDYLLGK